MNELKKEITSSLNAASSISDLEELKIKYMGKKGSISELSSKIKEIPIEERKNYGKEVNEVKELLNNLYNT